MSRLGYFAAGLVVATAALMGKDMIVQRYSDVTLRATPAATGTAPARLLDGDAPRDLPMVEADLS